MGDIEAREPSFTATLNKGERLKQQSHPATCIIDSYIAAMKDQWKLALNLSISLEQQIKELTQYAQVNTSYYL